MQKTNEIKVRNLCRKEGKRPNISIKKLEISDKIVPFLSFLKYCAVQFQIRYVAQYIKVKTDRKISFLD